MNRASESDCVLGDKIRQCLKAKGIESPIVEGTVFDLRKGIANNFKSIMECLNLDLEDSSLKDTPLRVAKMYTEEIFYGLDYANFPKCTTVENSANYDEMITETSQVMSICEHHFVPFIGTAYVSYIPKTKILGLSKFNRIVDFFSRRPQIQERLTVQIAAALQFITESSDVAVVIKAKHFCVHLRGVKDPSSETTTSSLSGKYRSVPELRNEFLTLTR